MADGNAASMGNLSNNAQQGAANPQVTQDNAPQVAPAQIQNTRHNLLGKAADFLLGKQVDYVPDANGEIQAVPRKQKPGELFRHLLAGAILGGAAGSRSSGFAQGIGTGGAAVQEQNVEQDQNKFNRAVEQQRLSTEKRKTDMEAQRLDQERQYQQAQIEHLKISDIRYDAQIDLARQEEIDRKNEISTTYENSMVEKGAVPSKISVNGKVTNEMTAPELMAAKIKDPSIDQAPNGYYRIHTTKTDTTGLQYTGGDVVKGADGKYTISGGGWKDKDGNNVNLSDRTKVAFYDVPLDAMKSTVYVSGKELNKLAGTNVYANDDEKHPIQLGEELTLVDLSTKRALTQQEIRLKGEQIGLESKRINFETKKIDSESDKMDKAQMMASERDLRDDLNSLSTELKVAESSMDREEVKRVKGEMDSTRKELDAIRKKVYPDTNITPPSTSATTPAAPAKPDRVQQVIDTAKANNNRIDYNYINSIPGLSPQEKLDLVKRSGSAFPITAINDMARKAGVSPDQMITQLKNQGYQIDTRQDLSLSNR